MSERYYYGELRLTRLNLYAKFIIGKFHYERVHGQYGAFFARYYGPLLFIFGILSIILSAVQVELGVETLTNAQWQSFWYASRWFCDHRAGVHGLRCVGPRIVTCWHDRRRVGLCTSEEIRKG